MVLVIVIGIVLAAGGLGLGLAWKAGLFGKPGGGPSDGTTTNGTQPTPPPSDGEEDPTKDWRNYTNSQYRYSFKYPTGWVLDERSIEEIQVTYPESSPLGGVSLTGPDGQMFIELIYESSGGEGPDKFIRDVLQRYADPDLLPVSTESFTIAEKDGVKASEVTGGMMYNVKNTLYVVANEGIGFYFWVTADVDSNGQIVNGFDATELEILGSIVSTFRFAE